MLSEQGAWIQDPSRGGHRWKAKSDRQSSSENAWPGLAWRFKVPLLDKLHHPVPDNLHGPAPRWGFHKLLSLPEKGLGETISRNVGETKRGEEKGGSGEGFTTDRV